MPAKPVDLITSTITHAIHHVTATRMHLAAAASEGDRVALMVRGAMLADSGIAKVAAAGKVEDALAALAGAVNAARAAEAALVTLCAELSEATTALARWQESYNARTGRAREQARQAAADRAREDRIALADLATLDNEGGRGALRGDD